MPDPATTMSKPIVIAPAPNGGLIPQSEDKPTMLYSCLDCARRKVRCDKLSPSCSTCLKTKAECIYQPPPPRKRKRRTKDDLHERLERYERLLTEHNLFPDDTDPEAPNSDNTGAYEPGKQAQDQETACIPQGKLVSESGRIRYMDGNLWKILETTGEGTLISDEESETEYAGSVYASPQDLMSATFFGLVSTTRSLTHFHPTYEAAINLSRVYFDGVEPIIKVLHKPTAAVILERAAANTNNVSKPTECLVFAVYHFAATTMTNRECLEMLGQEQSKLIIRYHDALRYALINADFLRSTDVQVMQAYVLFLLSVRIRYDPQLLWILTGVAIRMAQRMGLHRDGELIGLDPFSTEVNRRLFSQLPPLDGFASQFCGTGITIERGSWDVKHPLNINDEDVWPDMKEAPKEHRGATEMIYCLTKSELSKYYAKTRLRSGSSAKVGDNGNLKLVDEAEKQIDELESIIEMKFLRYCDPVNALHVVTSITTRAATNALRFRVRLPHAKAGLVHGKEREGLSILALQIMDHTIALHTNPALTRFVWHTSAFFVWDCLIWVLSEFRQGSCGSKTEAAWSKIETLFTCHPELQAPKRALAVAVTKLTLKAWDDRTAQEKVFISEPQFISNIRSAIRKRPAGKQSSMSTNTPTFHGLAMDDNCAADLLAFPDVDVHTNNVTATFFDDEINADTFDWAFWDQLVKDPDLSQPRSS